ncbi:hypothetical protein [uncultured Hymenobacter sp.]|uniref:hypothetical protein n=1 Tax=uncultured Hymenobacter sp. TaxID=170016 RepID=UPI0035C99C31
MARAHPYNFTHHLLPQLAWRRPEAVRRELSDPQLARELLHFLWDKAGETVPAAERVVARGLRLHWHEVAGRATALLLLPTPQATTEAYCAALVYETDPIPTPPAGPNPPGAALSDDQEEAEEEDSEELLPRYFTLEATLALADGQGPPTAVCEWQGEHRRHYGRGPAGGRPDTPTHFLTTLARLLGPPPGTDLPPVMRIV